MKQFKSGECNLVTDDLKLVTQQQKKEPPPIPPCSSCTRFGPNPVGRCPECGV
jgi:hypothetical protein